MNKKKTLGFIHDVNTIKDTINNINNKYNYKITLIGDRGYITSNKFNNIKRRNQKIQIQDIKLNKRKIIENTIACLKKNKRVMARKDHKIKNYMSWIYVSALLHNKNINMNINKK